MKRPTKPKSPPVDRMLSQNGKEVRVGCLIRDDGGYVGRVTYVEGNVVVYRLADADAQRYGLPFSAEFQRCDLTVIEEPQPPAVKTLATNYHPFAATWDTHSSDDTGIYHAMPGDTTVATGPLVATVHVNPDLGADANRVRMMMAAAPALWRELRNVARVYVFIADHESPEVAEDFARISNLLDETAGFFPFAPVEIHTDTDLYARDTEKAAAAGKGVAA